MSIKLTHFIELFRVEQGTDEDGFPVERDKEDEAELAGKRKEILDSLARGELSADEAVKLLKQK